MWSEGRRLVSVLDELDCPYVVVENDPTRHDEPRRRCANYVFGDAVDDYTMAVARLADARLVVSTIDHRPVSESLLDRDNDADLVLRADTQRFLWRRRL